MKEVEISTNKTYRTHGQAIQAVKNIAKKRYANIAIIKAWTSIVDCCSTKSYNYQGHAKCIVELENKLDVSGAVSVVKLLKDCPTDILISIKGLIESILIDRKK